jgi:hypothetical protein
MRTIMYLTMSTLIMRSLAKSCDELALFHSLFFASSDRLPWKSTRVKEYLAHYARGLPPLAYLLHDGLFELYYKYSFLATTLNDHRRPQPPKGSPNDQDSSRTPNRLLTRALKSSIL